MAVSLVVTAAFLLVLFLLSVLLSLFLFCSKSLCLSVLHTYAVSGSTTASTETSSTGASTGATTSTGASTTSGATSDCTSSILFLFIFKRTTERGLLTICGKALVLHVFLMVKLGLVTLGEPISLPLVFHI